MRGWAASLLSCALLPGIGLAASMSPEHIRSEVADYLRHLPPVVNTETRRVVEVGRIDPRIRLKPCPVPLSLRLSGRAPKPIGRVTVEVSCPGHGWRIRVPARVSVHAPVVVARKSLAAHARLTEADLKLEDRDISLLHAGMFTSVDSLKGAELRYPVAAGRVITPAQVVPDRPVRRNHAVTIVSGGPGFHIEVAGIALQDGRPGERIRVRNRRSGRVIEARVIGRDRVRAGSGAAQ
ncbi:MAG TPA: flagellar basal body P-ring formation protein FlgA [Thiotrichales bacterium]|nr:flagellar basal body P-ring formation protein FlgA [Thiotrichales bacterium]